MKTHSLIPNTPDWEEYRKTKFNASEASAMLSESKYMTRNELLEIRATGKDKPVTSALMALFERGHVAEAAARPIAESIIGEELYPVTGSLEVKDLPLSASFDGLTMLGGIVWEHKLLNNHLKESLSKGHIPYQYKPQLEQQLLVSGADKALFMSSEGTKETALWAWYESDPMLRHTLISGWKQFENDLKKYKPEIKHEKLIGEDPQDFPLVIYEMHGPAIISNINDVLPAIKLIAKCESNRQLETDQDFADKEVFNKTVKAARDKLKQSVKNVQSEFVSYAEFEKTAREIDSVLQKLQSSGEKAVKQAKEEKKAEIINIGQKCVWAYVKECNLVIKPYELNDIIGEVTPHWLAATKGKRNLHSIKSAVDDLVARTKIEINQAVDKIAPNAEYLKTKEDYKFLFSDISLYLNNSAESFKALVNNRIFEYKEEQENKKFDQLLQAAHRENAESDEAQRLERVKANKGKSEGKQDVSKIETTALDVPGCSIPHDCLHELTEWSDSFDIPLEAITKLEAILNKYFKG